MAVTRSSAAERAHSNGPRGQPPVGGPKNYVWTVTASLFVAAGLYLVYRAKTSEFPTVEQGLASKKLLDLNSLSTREDLLPVLAHDSRRAPTAGSRAPHLLSLGRPLQCGSRGAHARPAHRRTVSRVEAAGRGAIPRAVPRAPSSLWVALFFAGFLLVHASFWSLRGLPRRPDLPPRHSAADRHRPDPDDQPARPRARHPPVRRFRAGRGRRVPAAGGCRHARLRASVRQTELRAAARELRALAAADRCSDTGRARATPRSTSSDFSRWRSSACCWSCSWPATSPSAGTCCGMRARRRPSVARLTAMCDIPPLEYTLPVLVCVVLSLVFFFLQKDMGPALVFACLFLALYGIARGSAFVPVAGSCSCSRPVSWWAIVLGVPHTVRERVSMWLSPWDNLVHGGDQLAHSLWAFATGGVAGTGMGLGDPQLVPAAHTDLILSALGEEVGLRRRRGGLRALLLPDLASAADRLARAHRLRILSGGRPRRRHRAADPADRRRLAGRAAAVGRGHAVSELRPDGDAGQLCRDRHAAVHLGRGRRDSGPTPFRDAGQGARVSYSACWRGRAVAKAAYVQVVRSRRRSWAQGTLVVQADGARRYQYNPRFAGDHARDSQGHHLRPQRAAAGHQQLGRTGEAPRRVPGSSASISTAPARAATAATIRSAA